MLSYYSSYQKLLYADDGGSKRALSDADIHCRLHLIHILCRLSLTLSDSSTVVPTQTTVNKKGKSRTLDKDGRNKNRLSHTSAPLFLSKSKRPPQPPELSGATKRMPGGQQQLPRRQRSINTHGIHTHALRSMKHTTAFKF